MQKVYYRQQLRKLKNSETVDLEALSTIGDDSEYPRLWYLDTLQQGNVSQTPSLDNIVEVANSIEVYAVYCEKAAIFNPYSLIELESFLQAQLHNREHLPRRRGL